MVPNEKYRNPPIVEAVAAIRFADGAGWADETLASIVGELSRRYSGEPRQELHLQVQTTVANAADPMATATQSPGRTLYPEEDGSSMVGLKRGVVSVHVLRPYPGWESFRARIEHAVAIVEKHVGQVLVDEVAIRYVDRIALPLESAAELSAYFPMIPPRPEAMPESIVAYQTRLEAADPDEDVVASLTTAVAPPLQGESFVMLYDLNLVQGRFEAMRTENYMEVLERLHERQYTIFKQSITSQTEDLFR